MRTKKEKNKIEQKTQYKQQEIGFVLIFADCSMKQHGQNMKQKKQQAIR